MFSQTNPLYGIQVQDNVNPYDMNTNNMDNNYAYPFGAYYNNYRKGGGVSNLRDMAETLREQGRNGDTVLAHINPIEQEILKSYGGSGTINPKTGLPEYGFLKNLFKIIVPAIGSTVGGPLGAILSGAAHGALSSNSKNRLKGALQGAGIGAGYSAFAPMVGSAFGVNPTGMAGSFMGMNSPSLLSQLGIAGAPDAGGGLGFLGKGGVLSSSLSNIGSSGNAASLSGNMAQGSGGSGFGGNLLNNGLLGMGILGTLMRKEKPRKQESIEEYINKNNPKWGSEYETKHKKSTRKYNPAPIGYNPEIDTYHSFYNETNPDYENFSDGGAIFGLDDGEKDKRKIGVSGGEFVIRARAVANAGEGNTNAGFKKFDILQKILMEDGKRKEPAKMKSKITPDSMLSVLRRA